MITRYLAQMLEQHWISTKMEKQQRQVKGNVEKQYEN